MPRATAVVNMNGPAALRALARAFAHLGDFDRFVAGLQAALDTSSFFERTTIQLDRGMAEGAPHFSPGALALPLAGEGAAFGTLQVAPGGEHRQFDAADLHLMAGLADFLSVALTQALQAQDAVRAKELFRFLLNQAPVGIAAYAADRRLIVANDLAARWLAEGPPFDDLERGAGGFHVRTGGKLIYGEARRAGAARDWIVVLHDLTADQIRLLERMKRDAYRALAEGGRLGFALVESAQLGDGVLRRLPGLQAALRPGESAGPYDAHRVGLVLPGLDGVALRARLRELKAVFADAPGLRAGYAELGRDGRVPEGLLEAALQRYGDYDVLLRPALLVQDGDPAVAEMFSLVLGGELRVVTSTSAERTRELLAREVFELLAVELEPRSGPGGAELAAAACARHPGLKPLLTTIGAPVRALPAGTVAVEKPFDAEALRALVRARLAE